jgi:hypothetical protein
VAATLTTLLLMSPAARADAQAANKDRFACSSGRPELAIAACTRIIDGGYESFDLHVAALQNRGYLYQAGGDLDRAIAD